MKRFLLSFVAFFGLVGAAQACPNWNLDPLYGSYNLSTQQLRNGVSIDLTAGGKNSIYACSNVQPLTDTGPGYVESAPDMRIFVNGVEGRPLTMWISSNCDTVLLINTGTASWYYDDDDGRGANGEIRLTRPRSGQIDLWAGMYDNAYCDASLNIQAG